MTISTAPRAIRDHEAQAGVVSFCSTTSASRANTVTAAAIPAPHPPRNEKPVAKRLEVNSSSTAGMIGKGEAAIATAEASASDTCLSLVRRDPAA